MRALYILSGVLNLVASLIIIGAMIVIAAHSPPSSFFPSLAAFIFLFGLFSLTLAFSVLAVRNLVRLSSTSP